MDWTCNPLSPKVQDARHSEIEKRWRLRDKLFAKERGEDTGDPPMNALRVKDLNKIFDARYGGRLPDDDAGRDDASIMASYVDCNEKLSGWLRRWAPWMRESEINALVQAPKQHLRADALGKMLGLTHAERTALKITTIGGIDFKKAQRTKLRKKEKRLATEAKRRAQGATPRAESFSRTKPWEAEWISRSTWDRRRKNAI